MASNPDLQPPLSYKDAGVDIDAGNETVRRIKKLAKSTFTPGVLSDIGSFGGLFALEQLLGGVAPRAEVVLVEDHQVPRDFVEPFILRLDVADGVAGQEQLAAGRGPAGQGPAHAALPA